MANYYFAIFLLLSSICQLTVNGGKPSGSGKKAPLHDQRDGLRIALKDPRHIGKPGKIVTHQTLAATKKEEVERLRKEQEQQMLVDEVAAALKANKFERIGTIDELFIYPIKSLAANNVDHFTTTYRGAELDGISDRQFMVVDINNKKEDQFIRCKNYPKMVLVKTEIINGGLIVKFPAQEATEKHPKKEAREVVVELAKVIAGNHLRTTRFAFNNKLQAGFDCGDEIGEALDAFLLDGDKRKLRLIYYGKDANGKWPMSERDLDTEYYKQENPEYWKKKDPDAEEPPQVNDQVNYQDESAYMGFTKASIDDLNEHLEKNRIDRVNARYFRPNLVIKTDDPTAYQEEGWRFMKAGSAMFAVYKPCIRCAAININTETGIMGTEPLNFLKTFRHAPMDKYKTSPAFGMDMALIQPGEVHVGDAVYVTKKRVMVTTVQEKPDDQK